MIASKNIVQSDTMNTGDSSTLDSRLNGENPKFSSTLRSYPDSSFSARKLEESSAIQLLSDILGRNVRLDAITDAKGHIPTIPINDLRGEEASVYSRVDCILRRSLAALYRLVDIRGWTHSIYNHISARSQENPQHFLINPFGLLYHEIQASSLVKIDCEGNIIQPGSTVLGVNKAGWTLHSALHAVREDVNCIIHIHLPDIIAVSCIRAGLLPVSPEANELLISYGVRYHDYHGILVDASERATIQSDLGPKAKILFLRNHGVAIAASSVAEAWYLVKRVVAACQTQMRMLQLAGGASLLAELKDAAIHLHDHTRPFADLSQTGEDTQSTHEEGPVMNGKASSESTETLWSPTELEFEAEMRVLDSAGFRTGHVYRQPNLLRRTHAVGSVWGGDTFTENQATGAELPTTDFSATEFSAVDDEVATAQAVGAQQVAKIIDCVKVNRSKGLQRNQWLSDKRDPTIPNLVTSSLIASRVSTNDSGKFALVTQAPFDPPESPVCHTPVKRLHTGDNASIAVTSSARTDFVVPFISANSPIVLRGSPHQLSPAQKSATLPANVHSLGLPNAHTTDTLQSTDGITLSGDEEKPKLDKKMKKKGSFRMPSFSKKKKN